MNPRSVTGSGAKTSGLALATLMFLASPAALAQSPHRPVVVELFTAQGCSGCPEANRLIEGLGQEDDVIALTYGVNYWDYLGWSDTFARPEFAERQKAYSQAFNARDVATPQIIIDGRRQVTGPQAPALRGALRAADTEALPPPQIEFRQDGTRVGVGSGRVPDGGAEVVAVIYRPGLQTVSVNRGDNQGRTVRHHNVVREVHQLGPWRGRSALYDLPAKKVPQDKVVVMVQAQSDRHIFAAALAAEPD